MALNIFIVAELIQPKEKAHAIWQFVIPVVADVGLNALMYRFYSPGANATQPQYDDFRSNTWNKLSAEQRANEAWKMSQWQRNPKKPGWGRWAIPLTLALAVFGLAGDSLKDDTVPGMINSTTGKGIGLTLDNPVTYTGDPFGYTVVYNNTNFNNYLYSPYQSAVWYQGNAALGNAGYNFGQLDHIEKVDVFFSTYNGQKSVAFKVWYSTKDKPTTYKTFITHYNPALLDSFFSDVVTPSPFKNTATVRDPSTPDMVSEPNPSGFGERVVYVETPDPSTIVESPDDAVFSYMQNGEHLYDPNDYAAPTQPPADTIPADAPFWEWLLWPLEKILEILEKLFDFLKEKLGSIPEWFSSILSKLADILAGLGQWFSTLWDWLSKIFSEIGAQIQKLIDFLANIFVQLWEWLQSIIDAIQGLGVQLWEWLQLLLDTIKGIVSDIGTMLYDLLVPQQTLTSLLVPIRDKIESKINTPADFAWIVPDVQENGCPQDITLNGYMGVSGKIVDVNLVCKTAPWWRGIMIGFLYFLFGWWVVRKINAIMAKNGGIL